MSLENIGAFLINAESDKELQKEISAIPQTSKEEAAKALADLSQKNGTPFTSEEFLAAMQAGKSVSDAELENVAGGASFRRIDQITGGSIFKDFPKFWDALWK